MTEEQKLVYDQRLRYEAAIRASYQAINDAQTALNELRRSCKHDGDSRFIMSASGNESCYVCSICGGVC